VYGDWRTPLSYLTLFQQKALAEQKDGHLSRLDLGERH
jgi:hypothetical protein